MDQNNIIKHLFVGGVLPQSLRLPDGNILTLLPANKLRKLYPLPLKSSGCDNRNMAPGDARDLHISGDIPGNSTLGRATLPGPIIRMPSDDEAFLVLVLVLIFFSFSFRFSSSPESGEYFEYYLPTSMFPSFTSTYERPGNKCSVPVLHLKCTQSDMKSPQA